MVEGYTSYSIGYYLPSTPHIFREIYEHHKGGWDKTLDISPGPNKVIQELSKKFQKVIMIDPTEIIMTPPSPGDDGEKMRSLIKKLNQVADNSLDMVTAGEVAHWFDQEVFEHIGRILKPNGTYAMWVFAKPYVPGSEVGTETINQIFLKYNQLIPYSEKMDKVIQNMNSGLDKIKIPSNYFKIGASRVRVNYSNENYININGAYPNYLQLYSTLDETDSIIHIYRNDFLSVNKPLDWFEGFLNVLLPSESVIDFNDQFNREYQILKQEFGTTTNIPFSWSMNMVIATKTI